MEKLPNSSSGNQQKQLLNDLVIGIIFGLAGFALNWFNLELFFNVDFLFGSIITMFALMRFGLVAGVTAALIASSCTLHHWNHPWVMAIFTAEALCTGLLWRKRGWDTTVANLAFWGSGGLVLVFLSYQLVMGFPFSTAGLIALKQGVNGVFNTLIASSLYMGYCYRNRQCGNVPSLRQIIFVTTALFVVLPAFLFLYINVRHTLSTQLADHREKTALSALATQQSVSLWFQHGQKIIRYLAATTPPSQIASTRILQQKLDSMRATMPEFKRVGIVDSRAITVGFSPATDETGASTIGLDLSIRPYMTAVMNVPHPVITELFVGKIGVSGPRLIIVAPILAEKRYQGAAFGVAEFDSLKQLLQSTVQASTMQITLVDDKGRVVVSTRPKLKPLTIFTLPKNGSLMPFTNGVKQWIPNVHPGIGSAKRWMASFYLMELPLEINPGWKLVVEAPLKPTLLAIGYQASISLGAIALLLLLLIYSSRKFSKRVSRIVSSLEVLTRQIPEKISAGETIEWPLPETIELQGLTDNVRQMSESIQRTHDEMQNLNEMLEQRVEERTNRIVAIMTELSIILDTAPIGIAKIIDRKQVWVNNRLEELFMYSKEELESQTTRFLYASEQAYDTLGQEAPPVMAQGLLYETVQEMVRRDGAHVFVRFIGKAIDPTDLSKGSLWLSEDITSQRQTEQMLLESNRLLIEAKEQAESANRAKSEFLSNMSHEIRTPMNGVIGMAQLLAMTELTEEQQTYVDALKVSGNNLLTLINDILDLSKIEAGKIRLEMAEFSLQHCINNIVLTQKTLIYQKGLFLDVDVSKDVPLVLMGDELRVKQIIVNLLGNATKFTLQGGITISARLLEQQGSSSLIQLTVRDTGIGISAENLDKIFKPFTQEDGSTTRKFGGTGLGLTISLRMVELMGGNLSVESVQGSGSSFTVTLPFKISRNNSAVFTPDNTIEGIWGAPPLKILFVEDNPINMMFGLSLLEKLGHEVVTKENGRECLSALEVDTFDLVLMDIQMPLMNGEEALLEIRRIEQETGFHQPVIALTAYALRGEKERFLATGFDGFVSKPLVINELIFEMKLAMGLAGITG